jgi:hypothetical protein
MMYDKYHGKYTFETRMMHGGMVHGGMVHGAWCMVIMRHEPQGRFSECMQDYYAICVALNHQVVGSSKEDYHMRCEPSSGGQQ